MITIKWIDPSRLKNDEHLGFHYEVQKILAKYPAASIDLSDIMIGNYGKAINDEDLSYKIVPKSAYTDQITAADSVSDNNITGILTALRTLQKHFDPEVIKAANRVKIYMDAFGDIRRKPYVAQTTDITNLVQEFRGKLSADITLLSLDRWVDKLEADNNSFMDLFDQRHDEQAEKDSLNRFRDCRKATDSAYSAIVKRINAGIEFNGEEKYRVFVNDINTTITYYSNILAQRQGQSASNEK